MNCPNGRRGLLKAATKFSHSGGLGIQMGGHSRIWLSGLRAVVNIQNSGNRKMSDRKMSSP